VATRGTAIIIENNVITEGPEFNGDMYPHGFGDYFINKLSKVNNLNEFNQFNNEFNLENFDYPASYISNTTYTPDELKNENMISIENICSRVTSDWVFIKNLMDKSVCIEIEKEQKYIIIKSLETVRFNFGNIPNKGKGHRIKFQ